VDFRGVLYIPDEYRYQRGCFEHVAVAIGYNSFIGRTCCMHTVIQRPEAVTMAVVREAFEYPFIVCGCEAVLGLTDSANTEAIDFDKRLGFKELARIDNGGTEGDLCVMHMARSDCRWLRKH
jgi:hypothetical protein